MYLYNSMCLLPPCDNLQKWAVYTFDHDLKSKGNEWGRKKKSQIKMFSYWNPWTAPGFQLRDKTVETAPPPCVCELNLCLFLPCCVSEAWSRCLTAHHNSQTHWSSSHYSTPLPLVQVSAHPHRSYHRLYTPQEMRTDVRLCDNVFCMFQKG